MGNPRREALFLNSTAALRMAHLIEVWEAEQLAAFRQMAANYVVQS